MRVAGLQLDIANGDPATTFARAEALAKRAAAAGSRLVVLPEMFATGWAEGPPDPAGIGVASRRFLADLARRLGCWVVGGFALSGTDRPFNACALVAPDGVEKVLYTKAHLFALTGEERRYAAGEGVSCCVVEGVRVTPLICYDLRFPELFRTVADATDLFVVIANWPETRGHAWRTLQVARAIDTQAWLLGVNRVGEDARGNPHRGDSTLVDPLGLTAATLADQPGIVIGEVDPGRVADARRRFSFLADRRPELYARLEARSAHE